MAEHTIEEISWRGEQAEIIPIQIIETTSNIVEIPKNGIGELSDGYHTFNELYHHRAVLFSIICNLMPDKAWKSKKHDTGDMFERMFIVGIETPNGQATYHYDINPYWDMFKVKELEKAPKWDGHTPVDAINRIASLSANAVEVKQGETLLPLSAIELKHLINDTISYVWKLEDKGNDKAEFGYFSRKDLLDKLKRFEKENFQELDQSSNV